MSNASICVCGEGSRSSIARSDTAPLSRTAAPSAAPSAPYEPSTMSQSIPNPSSRSSSFAERMRSRTSAREAISAAGGLPDARESLGWAGSRSPERAREGAQTSLLGPRCRTEQQNLSFAGTATDRARAGRHDRPQPAPVVDAPGGARGAAGGGVRAAARPPARAPTHPAPRSGAPLSPRPHPAKKPTPPPAQSLPAAPSAPS